MLVFGEPLLTFLIGQLTRSGPCGRADRSVTLSPIVRKPLANPTQCNAAYTAAVVRVQDAVAAYTVYTLLIVSRHDTYAHHHQGGYTRKDSTVHGQWGIRQHTGPVTSQGIRQHKTTLE